MITVKFNGFELIVPASEIGAVVRQLTELNREQAIARGPKPAAAGPWPMPPAPQRQPALDLEEPPDDEVKTINFLRAIADHTASGGLSIDQVMKILGASQPKGVGSKAVAINKVIERYGYVVEDVYTKPRDTAGVRHWVSAPKIREAINVIKEGASRA